MLAKVPLATPSVNSMPKVSAQVPGTMLEMVILLADGLPTRKKYIPVPSWAGGQLSVLPLFVAVTLFHAVLKLPSENNEIYLNPWVVTPETVESIASSITNPLPTVPFPLKLMFWTVTAVTGLSNLWAVAQLPALDELQLVLPPSPPNTPPFGT